MSLPFSLSTAPRTFTKCLAPVTAYLRRVFPYLDDWLLVAPSKQEALCNTHFTLSLLKDLGLKMNFEKSMLAPSQVTLYIGAILDSISGRAVLLERRQKKIFYPTFPTSCDCHCSHCSKATWTRGLHHRHQTTCQTENAVSSCMVPIPFLSSAQSSIDFWSQKN